MASVPRTLTPNIPARLPIYEVPDSLRNASDIAELKPKTFDDIARAYHDKIFRVCLRILRNVEDAEDATQEAMLKACLRLDQFQSRSKFYTWLVRIAVNESCMVLRHLRYRRNDISFDEPYYQKEDGSILTVLDQLRVPDSDPVQGLVQSGLAKLLKKEISHLSPIFRSTLVLRDVEELSTEETAEMLGISVPAVKTRLLRARKQLRSRLAQYQIH